MADITEAQQTALDAYEKHGSYEKAAEALRVSKGTVYNHVKRAREAQLIRGEVPAGYKVGQITTRYDSHGEIAGQSVQVRQAGLFDPVESVPDPKKIVKTSTLFDRDGQITAQWVMTKPEDVQRERLWREFADDLSKKIERADEIPMPRVSFDEALAVYPVGDHHVGMLAWAIETRDDSYDLKTSERMLSQAAQYLMRAAAPAKKALICIMGDFVHFDGFRPETPTNKHLLDADSRFPKVARTARRMVRHLIEAALNYHETVHVIWEPGNHDPVSSIWLMELLDAVFENNPRVVIDTHPGKFHYYEYGRNLVMTHHGDQRIKPTDLPLIMAADMPEAWGRTDHRLILTGHVHHESRKDMRGAIFETVPVLIPNDAYAANAGYRSRRAMQVIILDAIDGEVERHTFNAKRFNRSI